MMNSSNSFKFCEYKKKTGRKKRPAKSPYQKIDVLREGACPCTDPKANKSLNQREIFPRLNSENHYKK